MEPTGGFAYWHRQSSLKLQTTALIKVINVPLYRFVSFESVCCDERKYNGIESGSLVKLVKKPKLDR